MKIISALIAVTCLTLSNIAVADITQRYNQINLNASASQEVENDQLVATLEVQETGQQPEQISQIVNAKMAKLLQKVKSHSDIKAQTTRYTTQPRYKNNQITHWQTSQFVTLTSLNIDLLADIVGQLTDLAIVQSLRFSVSDHVANETKEALTIQAIAHFREKALLISQQFDKRNYELVNVSINGNYNQPIQPRMMKAEMMSDSMRSAPALESGTNTLEISVNGTIELVD
jgi:predicted secreted protein